MIVAFLDREIRDTCEDEDKSILLYGQEATKQLQNRVLDLYAAESIKDILVGNLRETTFNNEIHFLLDLNNKYEMEFIPNHIDDDDFYVNDTLDWSLIKRVKIIAINIKL